MKKITLMLALAIGATTFAQTDLAYTDGSIDSGVLCDNAAPGAIDGSYSFVLGDFGVDASMDFLISEVRFYASALNNAPAAGLDAVVNVYTTDAPYPTGTLTLVESAIQNMAPGTEGTIYMVAMNAQVPGDSEVVVEVQFPDDGVTIAAIGSNLSGTGTSWVNGCGIAGPVDLADFLDNDWEIQATGDSVLGVNDNIADAVSIFPNPATDVINVRVPSNVTIEGVSVYDILGKDTGARLENGTINTSNFARGVYMLNVRTSAGSITEKIIKQ